MAETKSYTLRMPEVLLSRIDAYSHKNGMTQAQVVIQACRDLLDPEVPYMAPSTPGGKPDMQALRDICAGKIPIPNGESVASIRQAYFDAPTLILEIPICGKKWWEDGEHFECLMDAGHREQKHGMRDMVRVLS